MATGKVARRTAVGDVAELLDSPEIAALIAELETLKDNRGQKGYGEWKIEEIHYFNPSPTQLLEGTEVVVFMTSGEPPDKFVVDPFLTWKLVIEDCSIVDFGAMIDYVGNEILGSFDRDWD